MINERIKALREERGWSQSELSRRSGVAQGYISSIEDGKRKRISGDVLLKLAMALETTVDVLMGGKPLEDTTEPPIERLRSLGWPENELAALSESWDRQSVTFRLDVLRETATLERERQEQQDRIRAALKMSAPTT